MTFAVCHPDKKHLAKGLCSTCYDKKWYHKLHKFATCHPTRKHKANKLCLSCYQGYLQGKNPSVAIKHKEYSKGFRQKRLDIIHSLKAVPCIDCTVSYPHYVMEFDHRPGTIKIMSVSRMVGSAPWKQVLEEIAKCDIVCANCHNVRTYMRRTQAVNL